MTAARTTANAANAANVANVAFTGDAVTGEYLAGDAASFAPPPAAGVRAIATPWVLLLLGFVDTAGSLLTVLRTFERARDMGMGDFAVGALAAVFAASQMVSALAWGRLSDRLGRRPVLLAGLVTSLVAYLLFARATSLTALVAARALHGIGSGTAGVVLATIADSAPQAARARLFGHLGAATSLGAVAGPLLVMLLTPHGARLPELAMGAVVALALVVAWRCVPRGRFAHSTSPGTTGAVTAALRSPVRVRWLIGVYAVAVGAASGIPVMLPVLLDTASGVPSAAWCVMFLGASGAIFRAAVVGPVASRFGECALLAVGLACVGSGVAMLAVPVAPPVVLLALTAMALGTALTFPALGALITRATPAAQRGATMGAQQAVGGVSRAIVPLLIGVAVDAGAAIIPLLVTAALLIFLAARVQGAARRVAGDVSSAGARHLPPARAC